jgi:acyl dehydratase
VVDRDEMIAYAKVYDPFPIHVDDDAAAQTPHGEVIASFGYTVSLFFKLVHLLPSNQTASPGFLGGLGWRVTFHRGLRAGDEVRLLVTVKSTRLTSRGDRGVLVSDCVLVRQDDEPIVTIEVTSMYLTRPADG